MDHHQLNMNNDICLEVTYRSSPNIAWIKYWGKYNQQYILPINDSLGVTLNSDDIYTQTTITYNRNIKQNKIILNDSEHPISKRMTKMFRMIKDKAYDLIYRNKINQ